jgi:hypothetical protein
VKKIRLFLAAAVFVAVAAHATVINEKFSADPLSSGWQIFGDTSLFQWDSTNENLAVTWDSSRTNSYFYHPLGATFTQADGFCVLFDLKLNDADASGYFQIAVGLCNYAEATGTNFSRANAASPDLFEFDYYPDGPMSYGPSIDATLADSVPKFYFAFDATQPLPASNVCRVVLIHRAGAAAISGTVFTNGQPMTRLTSVYANGPTNGFNLDTLAVFNYTTLDDFYGDAVLAHGTIDNLAFASPLPVEKVQSAAAGEIRFASDTNWLYALEQTTDFKTWLPASPATAGNGTNLILLATNPPPTQCIYRVRAELP